MEKNPEKNPKNIWNFFSDLFRLKEAFEKIVDFFKKITYLYEFFGELSDENSLYRL